MYVFDCSDCGPVTFRQKEYIHGSQSDNKVGQNRDNCLLVTESK